MEELRKHIDRKKSRIILAYDKNDYQNLLKFIENLHDDLIGVKVHSEILNLTKQQNEALYKLCKSYDLFLWEDRKFNDIANTFNHQIKSYESIRDYVSVCPISGVNILQVNSNLKYFVLIEMSSRNNFINNISEEIYHCVKDELKNNNSNIAGIICQSNNYINQNMITIKPGINARNKKDNIGQVYNNIHDLQVKPSLIVVGRGLTNATNPKEEIKLYKY